MLACEILSKLSCDFRVGNPKMDPIDYADVEKALATEREYRDRKTREWVASMAALNELVAQLRKEVSDLRGREAGWRSDIITAREARDKADAEVLRLQDALRA